MKILQLVTKRQYRGAEVFAANLSAELIKLGHSVIFAGLYRNELNVLEVENADNRDLSNAKTNNLSFSLIKDLGYLIKEVKPDVIQCNGSDTLKYMIAASLFTPKIPIIYRNISIISEWISSKPKYLIYKKIFQRVDHVSSVGEEAVNDLIKTFDYDPAKTSVIRRGIPIKKVDKTKQRNLLNEQFGLQANDKIAMHIGNFSPEKNHKFLLEIFSKIKQSESHLKLVLVGTGILFEEVERSIKEMGLQETVYLAGFRKDIPELLAAADCFLLVSKVEGVPGVILEAAAQKKPSIATNVGGVNEVLKNRETGFIIENFDQEEYCEKLIFLMKNEDLRREMGDNAFKLVNNEFNPEKNARMFQNLYSQIISDIKRA